MGIFEGAKEYLEENLPSPDVVNAASATDMELLRSFGLDDFSNWAENNGFGAYKRRKIWHIGPTKAQQIAGSLLSDTRQTQLSHVVSASLTAFGRFRAICQFGETIIADPVGQSIYIQKPQNARDFVDVTFALAGGLAADIIDVAEVNLVDEEGKNLFSLCKSAHGDLNYGEVYVFMTPLQAGGRVIIQNTVKEQVAGMFSRLNWALTEDVIEDVQEPLGAHWSDGLDD